MHLKKTRAKTVNEPERGKRQIKAVSPSDFGTS